MFTINEFVQNAGAPSKDARFAMVDGGSVTSWDPGLRRPYVDNRGRVWVDVTTGYKERRDAAGKVVLNTAGIPIYDREYDPQLVSDRMMHGLPVMPVNNATALRKEQWQLLDSVVLKSVRARLKAWADLRAANTYGGFDGMATPVLEHELMTDGGEAVVDMDGLSEGRNFTPEFGLQGMPLPITHADFFLPQRFLAVSRTKGQPADTIRAEQAARRVGETIEQTLIGTLTGMTYGTATVSYLATAKVYGYTNHPSRITYTSLTASATLTTNIATTGGTTFVSQVLAMLELAYDQNYFGPFMLYVSPAYDALLDNDLKANSDLTIRQRVREIDNITDVRRLDYLTGDVLLLVQMTEDVAQAVNGMEVSTVQWEEKGGMQLCFKVMGIQVPRIRAAYKSLTTTLNTGIVHGTTS